MPEPLSNATESDVSVQETSSDSETPLEEDSGSESQPEVFSREYVEKLRAEAAQHRVKAKHADQLAQTLVTAYADSTGRLHDPSDLLYSEQLLDEETGMPDREKVAHAIEVLVQAKPHLAKLRVVGDVGQGVQGDLTPMPGLADMLRRNAG